VQLFRAAGDYAAATPDKRGCKIGTPLTKHNPAS